MKEEFYSTYFDYNLFDTLSRLISLYDKLNDTECSQEAVEGMIAKYENAAMEIMRIYDVSMLHYEKYLFSVNETNCRLMLKAEKDGVS